MWIFWLLWVVVGVSVELWAVANKPEGDTLSEQVWKVNVFLARWPWLRVPLHFVLAGFLLMLIPHFLWGRGL